MVNLALAKGWQLGGLTLGETISLAQELGLRVSDVVIAEAVHANRMTPAEVRSAVQDVFCHNLYAAEVGLTTGSSFLMGSVGQELSRDDFANELIGDRFLNKVLVYTLGAQVGNHVVGLQPCAGTGDACVLTGLFKAMQETVTDQEELARVTAVMLKVATIFRIGKSTSGCNMEGLGAGAACTSAVMVELAGGPAEAMSRAVTLALSPTIGVPCTPRVMVPGLCATHIGGGVLIGHLAARLALSTYLPVTVPVDAMIALAAAVHPVSAQALVPLVIRYMQPFFKTNQEVERYVAGEVKEREEAGIAATILETQQEARNLARQANSIVRPFGEAVVAGSSMKVGSPTHAARLAHALSKGEIKGVKIELCPELYACRGINVPGILMGAVFGASTNNAQMYREVMGMVRDRRLRVEILEVNEPQLQRITVYATEADGMVDTLNRGGGRLVLRRATPSRELALKAATTWGIEIVD
ncbi:serine dehydratase [Clostridiales bacterium PH28_bin88]|nr:serine dehydratase [Clostridiales bacterium PH28_bin88]